MLERISICKRTKGANHRNQKEAGNTEPRSRLPCAMALKLILERGATIPHLSRWVIDRRAYNRVLDKGLNLLVHSRNQHGSRSQLVHLLPLKCIQDSTRPSVTWQMPGTLCHIFFEQPHPVCMIGTADEHPQAEPALLSLTQSQIDA